MSVSKVLIVAFLLTLSGCSTVHQLQNLDVSLTGIEPAGTIGLAPRFNIQLLVSNPNPQDVEIDGMSINLDIAKQHVLSGLSSHIPTLRAYSETPVEIQTTVNVFSLYKLVTYLTRYGSKDIRYQLNTRIDPSGFIAFDVVKKGILQEDILQTITR